jgi:hypothetical protein
MPETNEETRRTAALALWRYGHDYLRAVQALAEKDGLPAMSHRPSTTLPRRASSSRSNRICVRKA